MRKGIDISQWQGNVDFDALNNDIDFIILRCGYGTTADPKFFEYVNGAKSAGIPIDAVYHFIYGINSEDVKANARKAVDLVKQAGLNCRIFCDLEYDTIDKAKNSGITLGKNEIQLFTRTFCNAVKDAGLKTGMYTNLDFINRFYGSMVDEFDLWLAHYAQNPARPCMYHQYSSSGRVSGIIGNVDMDYCYLDEMPEKKEVQEMTYSRSKVVGIMQEWLKTSPHYEIVDIYNTISPLPVGYRLTYSDAWCAGTVSACFHKAGYDSIFPSECSCPRMIQKAMNMGIWVENDAYIPKAGDCILYDWEDSGYGDNQGTADHVGMVESVSGNTISVIEGNNNDAVRRRTIAVDSRYIRGYVCPKFSEVEPMNPPENPTNTQTEQKQESGGTLSKVPKYVGRCTATDFLNVRSWAGTEYKNIKSYPRLAYGNLVDVCDSVKASDGSVWHYVRIAGKYFGFVHSAYIEKV